MLKVIITRVMAILFVGLVFTVCAAEFSASHRTDALERGGTGKTIVTVEASQENQETSLEASLAIDGPEGRTMEALSVPPAYAEASGDSETDVQRNGNSVNAATRETTTVAIGNSSAADAGYVNLAANASGRNNSTIVSDTNSSSVNAAVGTPDVHADSSSGSAYAAANATHGNSNKTAAASEADSSSVNAAASAPGVNTDSSSVNAAASTAQGNKTTVSGDADSSSISVAANTAQGKKTAAASDANSSSATTAANTVQGNKTTTASETDHSSVNAAANAAHDNEAAAVGETDNSPVNTAANAADSKEAASADSTGGNKTYHHTTSIYADDDTTLLRVEYLDENGKVVEYSSVTDYDKDTNSYTETVYMYDWDEEKEYVMRTDTYVDGELVSSENP